MSSRNPARQYASPGWDHIVDAIYDTLDAELGSEGYSVQQVKEKFGGLRFYWNTTAESRWASAEFIDGMAAVSEVTCERCGGPGELRQDRSWVTTLCDECNEVSSG